MNGPVFPAEQPPLSRLDFEYVRGLVRSESSIILDDSKTYLVTSRLLPLARANGFPTVGALISQLQATRRGKLHEQTVEALVTTETSFFRDLHPFFALRDEILPELVEKRMSGVSEVAELATIDAAAGIEQQHGAHGYGLDVHQLHILPHSAVEDLEVVGGQAAHPLAIVSHEDVDVSGANLDLESRRLLGRSL